MGKRGPTRARPTPRVLEGIPGTVEPGFRERELVPVQVPREIVANMEAMGLAADRLRMFRLGPCSIMVAQEPAGPGGALLWHLTISTPSRHPTWDEIKVARYRLLPPDVSFAMILPPPDEYVNVPQQDHVMQLWEILDPRSPAAAEPLALYFTPDAIREHFDGEDSVAAAWVASATDDELRPVGEYALCGDSLYREFHELLVHAVAEELSIDAEDAE